MIRIGDIARRNRAIKLAAVACLAEHDEPQALELLCYSFSFLLAVQVRGLKLSALLIEARHIIFCGAKSLALRRRKLRAITVAYFYDVAHLAEAANSFQENNLHGGALLFQHIRQEPEETGPLDGFGKLALLFRGDCRDPARHDLAALGNEALQKPNILIIDLSGALRP